MVPREVQIPGLYSSIQLHISLGTTRSSNTRFIFSYIFHSVPREVQIPGLYSVTYFTRYHEKFKYQVYIQLHISLGTTRSSNTRFIFSYIFHSVPREVQIPGLYSVTYFTRYHEKFKYQVYLQYFTRYHEKFKYQVYIQLHISLGTTRSSNTRFIFSYIFHSVPREVQIPGLYSVTYFTRYHEKFKYQVYLQLHISLGTTRSSNTRFIFKYSVTYFTRYHEKFKYQVYIHYSVTYFCL